MRWGAMRTHWGAFEGPARLGNGRPLNPIVKPNTVLNGIQMVGRLYLCYGFEEKQPWHVLRQSMSSRASQESVAAEATNTSPSTPVQTASTWRSTWTSLQVPPPSCSWHRCRISPPSRRWRRYFAVLLQVILSSVFIAIVACFIIRRTYVKYWHSLTRFLIPNSRKEWL